MLNLVMETSNNIFQAVEDLETPNAYASCSEVSVFYMSLFLDQCSGLLKLKMYIVYQFIVSLIIVALLGFI